MSQISKDRYGYLIALGLFLFSSINTYGLLTLWLLDGHPRYSPRLQAILFISDVGAVHKTFFIIFSTLSAAFLILTDHFERDHRRSRRSIVQKSSYIFDVLSPRCLRIGATCCILLSIFDAFNYWSVHAILTFVYVQAVGFSLVTQAIESVQLSKLEEHPNRYLHKIAMVKCGLLIFGAIIVTIFVVLVGSCVGRPHATGRCDVTMSTAGVLEWGMAITLSGFYLTFAFDLYPRQQVPIPTPVKKNLLKVYIQHQVEEPIKDDRRLRMRSPKRQLEPLAQPIAVAVA